MRKIKHKLYIFIAIITLLFIMAAAQGAVPLRAADYSVDVESAPKYLKLDKQDTSTGSVQDTSSVQKTDSAVTDTTNTTNTTDEKTTDSSANDVMTDTRTDVKTDYDTDFQKTDASKLDETKTETTGIEHEDIGIMTNTDAAMTDKAILVDTISSPDDSDLRAVFIKLGDIKGETTDTKANNDTIRDDIEIEISGVDVRGWDPQTKKAVTDAAPQDVRDVRSESDLALFAASAAEKDEAIEHVTLNFEEIKVDYQSQGRLFGFMPIVFKKQVTVDIDTTKENDTRVKVRFPWYRFLMRVDVSGRELQKEITDALEAEGITQTDVSEDQENIEKKTENLVRTFQTLSNILKTKHDIATSAIRNIR